MKPSLKRHFATQMTLHRNKKGFTPAQLASMIDQPVNSITIYESARQIPKWAVIEKICKALTMNIDEFRGYYNS